MKNSKRLFPCVLVLALCFAASCKHKDKKEFQPSPLASGLYSGQSLEAVERNLDMMAGSFDVVVDRKPLPDDTRPPYRLLVISEKRTRVDGQPGELEMTFFNDRLMTMQFYAADMKAARAAVGAAGKISLAGGDSFVEPSTRIWVGKDESGRSYIGWIDKSLQAEQDAWIARYDAGSDNQSAQ
jgi:hypothetical protein